jgi:hypothetical protein
MLLPLPLLLPIADCCGIASDRRGDDGSLSLFDDTGVDGVVLDSSAAFVFGANDTLLLLLVGEEDTSSCSLCECCSGESGCSEAFGDRVSDSKDAAFRTSSSSFESFSFLSVFASLDSLGGLSSLVTLPALLPPGLRFAREASAKAEANSVGSTFFLSADDFGTVDAP